MVAYATIIPILPGCTSVRCKIRPPRHYPRAAVLDRRQQQIAMKIIGEEKGPYISNKGAHVRAAARLYKEHDLEVSYKTLERLSGELDNA